MLLVNIYNKSNRNIQDKNRTNCKYKQKKIGVVTEATPIFHVNNIKRIYPS